MLSEGQRCPSELGAAKEEGGVRPCGLAYAGLCLAGPDLGGLPSLLSWGLNDPRFSAMWGGEGGLKNPADSGPPALVLFLVTSRDSPVQFLDLSATVKLTQVPY